MEAFRRYLVKYLIKLRQEGGALILMADINERIYIRYIATELRIPYLNKENAMMMLHPNLDLPETFYKGKGPIDGLFVTPDMETLSGA